jgi:aldehyde:ferredoxin oxidoreductase
MHDPRGSHGLGLAYMMSYRGACHKAHLAEGIEHGFQEYKGVGLKENYEGPTSEGKGLMVRISEDLGVPLNALAICEFEVWCFQFDDVVRSVKVCTGWDYSLEEYMATGRRLWLLKRGLNNLMGVARADDRMPKKILTPVPDGAVAGIVPDVELMLREYYEERGLEENGRPKREVLEQAGLEDLARVLDESA